MSQLPRITVVTPSLNQARYLERTIRSVLEQDYPNLEYFIMDGGSTDGSVEIIRRYANQIDYWTSGPDGGQSAAINAGWRRASGVVLAWLNSDDFYLPGTLAFVGEFFRSQPDAFGLYGPCQSVDTDGQPLGYMGEPFDRRTMILSRNIICQPASFVSRRAVEIAGYLDEQLHYTMDLDLFLRIAKFRAPVYVARPLAAATVHQATKTTRERGPMGRERQQVRLRHADTLERPLVSLQSAASTIFHRSPRRLRALIDRLRPRRVFTSPPREGKPEHGS